MLASPGVGLRFTLWLEIDDTMANKREAKRCACIICPFLYKKCFSRVSCPRLCLERRSALSSQQPRALRGVDVVPSEEVREALIISPIQHTAGRELTKSEPHGGEVIRCCFPPSSASLLSASRSSWSSWIVFRLDSIRAGVTDLGRTTMPRLTPYEMRAVAGETLCFSAILISAGSFASGEPGVSQGHGPCSTSTYRSIRGASRPG